ncbi:hypothetical protein [Gryllotalpicola protaetiae]|uniref:hypothetical protein n=1 Tax=Gryllotalpicola protaetiae TaxID=2419771 RepID=UPI0013C42A1B|nr:hypothetical protein [Gryllotalpicola protaetiae]
MTVTTEVSWQLEGITLFGTLLVPDGDGPCPGVVLVAGAVEALAAEAGEPMDTPTELPDPPRHRCPHRRLAAPNGRGKLDILIAHC